MKAVAVIPSRYASKRLPGKPLAKINGKPMIEYVYQNVSKSKLISDVIVATDNEKIAEVVNSINGKSVITDLNLQSGTDRIWEAVQKLNINADIILNIQGDEPLIHAELVDNLILEFQKNNADVGTVIKKITDKDEITNTSVVKVIKDKNNYALYFSRNVIPFLRDVSKEKLIEHHNFFKHIGIYAYTYDSLKRFVSLEQSSLEKAESLEQLRLLYDGAKYYCYETEHTLIGVDEQDDIIKVEDFINKNKQK